MYRDNIELHKVTDDRMHALSLAHSYFKSEIKK